MLMVQVSAGGCLSCLRFVLPVLGAGFVAAGFAGVVTWSEVEKSCLHAAGAGLHAARMEMDGPGSWVDTVNSHTWLAVGVAPADGTSSLYAGRETGENVWMRVNWTEAYGTLVPRTDAAFVRLPSGQVLLQRLVSHRRLRIQGNACLEAMRKGVLPEEGYCPDAGVP